MAMAEAKSSLLSPQAGNAVRTDASKFSFLDKIETQSCGERGGFRGGK
jgi:hypothetical protein